MYNYFDLINTQIKGGLFALKIKTKKKLTKKILSQNKKTPNNEIVHKSTHNQTLYKQYYYYIYIYTTQKTFLN